MGKLSQNSIAQFTVVKEIQIRLLVVFFIFYILKIWFQYWRGSKTAEYWHCCCHDDQATHLSNNEMVSSIVAIHVISMPWHPTALQHLRRELRENKKKNGHKQFWPCNKYLLYFIIFRIVFFLRIAISLSHGVSASVNGSVAISVN